MNPRMSLWIMTPSLMLLVKMKGNRQLYKKKKKMTTEMDNRKNIKMGLCFRQKKYFKLLAQKKKEEEVNL
ncbi:unnamed protein product [Prunus armeniaca]|uniref:Uncharacterized protein n=1 Tax=Prunus armeniaca TaxID=36596 RepID=A0A6J5UID7_PRUAR|nr:unnamed protein product [Prunus armeniaca]